VTTMSVSDGGMICSWKCPRCAKRQVFPEDRFEGDGVSEFALKPLQDPYCKEPLETNVARGREEDAERKLGHDTVPTDER
jgi:hypothetical protein